MIRCVFCSAETISKLESFCHNKRISLSYNLKAQGGIRMNDPNRFRRRRPRSSFTSFILDLPGLRSNALWKKVLVAPLYLLVALLVLLGLFGGGIGSIVDLLVIFVIIIAIVALVNGSLPRFKIPNRKVAAVLLVAALVLSFL